VRTRIARIYAFLQEHFSAQTVQIFKRKRKSCAAFAASTTNHRKATSTQSIITGVFSVGGFHRRHRVALVIWYGGYRVMQHALSLGALVAFIQYSDSCFSRFGHPDKYNVLQARWWRRNRIFKALDLPIRSRRRATAQTRTR